MGKIEDFIAHYSSKYYDPVKAREYYLRTRELKGRRASKDLKTAKKKEAWSYAKSEITNAKKQDLKTVSEQRKAEVQTLRDGASARREKIRTLLKFVMDMITKETGTERIEITEKQKAKLEQISSDAQAKIDNLPPIPKGASKETIERLRAERKEEVAKIRGEASKAREGVIETSSKARKTLSDKTSKSRETERDSASAERERVSSELRSSVDQARTNYETRKAELIAQYEEEYDREYAAIRQNV